MLSEQAVLKHWAAEGRSGLVLTEAERQDVVSRIRCDYEAGDRPWPGTVTWVGSPSELERCRLAQAPDRRRRWFARRSPAEPAPEVIEEVGPGPRADPASGWIAFRDRVVICEPPRVLRTEPVGTAGRHRLHHDAQPAVEWADGVEPGYYLHGVAVPEPLFRQPSVEAIHREANSEVRRLVIERMGWPRYIAEAELSLVAEAEDPGNAGHRLQLYDLPKGRYEPARLLRMANGSPDRSGQERHYFELVPAWIDDPVQAAAWQYGCPVAIYRQLARRT
jgi:hypothetical protein